jgi:hypothetical protein
MVKKKRSSSQIWEWKVCVNEKDEEAVGVLCICYEVECNGETLTGELTPSKMATHGFFPCSKYIVTIPSPIPKKKKCVSTVMLKTETIKELSPYFSPFAVPLPSVKRKSRQKRKSCVL